MATTESSRQSSPKTPDDSSIVATDCDGQTLTACERRAVSAVVRKHQQVFDHADGLSPNDVGVKKRETGVLKIRFAPEITVTDTTAERGLPNTWSLDSMMAHHGGKTAIEVSHENR